jgi:hypothetical protein
MQPARWTIDREVKARGRTSSHLSPLPFGHDLRAEERPVQREWRAGRRTRCSSEPTAQTTTSGVTSPRSS